MLILGISGRLSAQQEVTLFAEPVAAGAQYLYWACSGLSAGAAVTVGPMQAVVIASADLGDARNWATAYATFGYRTSGGLQLLVSPIGGALIVGNDFRAVYPSAQAGMELARRQLRFGSLVRVIRIPGPDTSGPGGNPTYWTEWLPVRIGYAI